MVFCQPLHLPEKILTCTIVVIAASSVDPVITENRYTLEGAILIVEFTFGVVMLQILDPISSILCIIGCDRLEIQSISILVLFDRPGERIRDPLELARGLISLYVLNLDSGV